MMRTPPLFADTPTNVIRLSDGPNFASTVREIVALVDAAMPGSQMMLGASVRRDVAVTRRAAAARITGTHCCNLCDRPSSDGPLSHR